jgi:outer membrane protein OmpA-like peptidoglycan-associated protein
VNKFRDCPTISPPWVRSWVPLGVSAACIVALSVACGSAPHPPLHPPTAVVNPLSQDEDVDGFPDGTDRCPIDAEDGNPPEPSEGCPNRDLDADGVPVPLDLCPLVAETLNAELNDDGCPDLKAEVDAAGAVSFLGDVLEQDRESLELEALARLMLARSPTALVEVAVHHSEPGDDRLSLSATQQRAEHLAQAMSRLGVSPTRILSRGYGHYCIAEGSSGERIAFILHETEDLSNSSPGSISGGCEAYRAALPSEPQAP